MLEEGDFGKLTKQQKDTVSLTLDGANRMARLIDDLLNVSRMDANRFFLEVEPVDIGGLVEQELKQLEVMAKTKNVKITYSAPKSKIPLIRLDETKTRQVVMNLVDNAIHYSKPEGGEVLVNLGVEGKNVVFEVRDNGIGVPVSEQSKLFSKMFRAQNAQQVRPDGTGLGLYMVKRVVTDQAGSVIFESQEGKGSTFGFKLPLSGVPKSTEEASKKIGEKVTLQNKKSRN
jgi:signal transduction histidine kinase